MIWYYYTRFFAKIKAGFNKAMDECRDFMSPDSQRKAQKAARVRFGGCAPSGCDVAYSSSGISVSSQKRTVTFFFCITYSALPK